MEMCRALQQLGRNRFFSVFSVRGRYKFQQLHIQDVHQAGDARARAYRKRYKHRVVRTPLFYCGDGTVKINIIMVDLRYHEYRGERIFFDVFPYDFCPHFDAFERFDKYNRRIGYAEC